MITNADQGVALGWSADTPGCQEVYYGAEVCTSEGASTNGFGTTVGSIQRILSERCGTITDIYERDSHTLVSKG
jgi:hypothetical protein